MQTTQDTLPDLSDLAAPLPRLPRMKSAASSSPRPPKAQSAPPPPTSPAWSFADDIETQDFIAGAGLKVSARGQSATHNRKGLDHRAAADIAVNPNSPEGKNLVSYLQERGIPHITSDGSEAWSTGAHVHLGETSHRTNERFDVGATRSGLPDLSDLADLSDLNIAPPVTSSPEQQNALDDDVIEMAATRIDGKLPIINQPTLPPLPPNQRLDLYSTRGRAERDQISEAERSRGGRRDIDVSLPQGVEDWTQVSSENFARAGYRQAAKERGIPESFAEEWFTKNGARLHRYDDEGKRVENVLEHAMDTGAWDSTNNRIRVPMETSHLAKLEDDYRATLSGWASDPTRNAVEKAEDVVRGGVRVAGDVGRAVGSMELPESLQDIVGAIAPSGGDTDTKRATVSDVTRTMNRAGDAFDDGTWAALRERFGGGDGDDAIAQATYAAVQKYQTGETMNGAENIIVASVRDALKDDRDPNAARLVVLLTEMLSSPKNIIGGVMGSAGKVAMRGSEIGNALEGLTTGARRVAENAIIKGDDLAKLDIPGAPVTDAMSVGATPKPKIKLAPEGVTGEGVEVGPNTRRIFEDGKATPYMMDDAGNVRRVPLLGQDRPPAFSGAAKEQGARVMPPPQLPDDATIREFLEPQVRAGVEAQVKKDLATDSTGANTLKLAPAYIEQQVSAQLDAAMLTTKEQLARELAEQQQLAQQQQALDAAQEAVATSSPRVPSPRSGRMRGEAPLEYGSANRLVTPERADAARARLRQKFNPNRATMGAGLGGIDPTAAADLAVLAAYHVEAGAWQFDDFVLRMVEDAGEKARPVARQLWEGAHANLKRPLPDDSTATPSPSASSSVQAGASASGVRPRKATVGETVLDVVNAPKTLKASADLSAPFRQGAILSVTEPLIAGRAFASMARSFSPAKHREFVRELEAHPARKLADRNGLYLASREAPGGGTPLSQREENFMSQLVGKVPVVGQVTRFSDRTYSAYLDRLRIDTFDKFTKEIQQAGGTKKDLEDIARFINIATGRGELGKYGEAIAPVLSTAMFSPRFVASRFQFINPVRYAKMSPVARKIAMRKALGFVTVTASALAMAKTSGVADVDLNPESSDFGKIRVGNTRYDLWAGEQQTARFLYRMGKGFYNNMTGGKNEMFDEPVQVATQFLRSKLAPVPSFVWSAGSGKDFKSDKFNPASAAAELVVPIMAKDLVEAYREEGKTGLLKTMPGIFGVGVTTYADKSATGDEDLSRELRRLGVGIGAGKRGKEESEADFAAREREARTEIERELSNLVRSDDYKRASENDRKAKVKAVQSAVRGEMRR